VTSIGVGFWLSTGLRHWRLRPNTLDARLFRNVVIENEYRLPVPL
jgi:hypothetical protein